VAPEDEIRIVERLFLIAVSLEDFADGVLGCLGKIENPPSVPSEIESALPLPARNERGGEPFALRRGGIPGKGAPERRRHRIQA
jgi:hypothetical protein